MISSRSSYSSSGFSLIELLIVISIFAGLVVLSLSAIGVVRTKSKQVGCTGNLREIGVAIFAYSHDHGGMLPGPVSSVHRPMANAGAQSATLPGLLAPYLGVKLSGADQPVPQFICPTARDIAKREGRRLDRLASYVGPFSVWHRGEGVSDMPLGYRSSDSRTIEPKRLQALSHPQMTLLLMDYDGELLAPRGLVVVDASYSPSHGQTRNILFADGRVEPYLKERFRWSIHQSVNYLSIE